MSHTHGDVLGAVADLTTRTTTPSTLEVFDWVTGKRALRGHAAARGGPAPWFGLEPALRALEADGFVQITSDSGTASGVSPMSRPPQNGLRRVRLTAEGRLELAGISPGRPSDH